MVARALVILGLVGLGGCAPAVIVPEQLATVACGTCVFEIPQSQGCYWAAEIDGVYHPVTGAVPADHEPHAPDGMCNMPRTATVEGKLTRGVFFATRFDLEPAEAVPDHESHEHAH